MTKKNKDSTKLELDGKKFKEKKKKRKNFVVRDFTREIKRVKWPENRQYFKLFVYVIIFLLVTTLFFFGIVTGFTQLFNVLGIGV